MVLSVHDELEDLARSRAAGFAAHLRKPVALGTLHAAIARVTASAD